MPESDEIAQLRRDLELERKSANALAEENANVRGYLAAAKARIAELEAKVEQVRLLSDRLAMDERALAAANARAERYWKALAESVQLQSHYAVLLNGYDRGQRLQFSDAHAWLDRLAALSGSSAEARGGLLSPAHDSYSGYAAPTTEAERKCNCTGYGAFHDNPCPVHDAQPQRTPESE
jgi:DNA repair exonuclease SbcCD ATPase subunit